MRYLLVLAVVMGIVAVGSANSFAATSMYKQYGNNKASSVSADFPSWIPLDSMAFSKSRPTSSNFVSGAPQFTAITITKQMDVSSVPLMQQLLASGPQTAKIDFATNTGTGKELTFAQYDLTNALVTGYSVSSGGDRPSESKTLQFQKISFTYTPINNDGTLGTPSTVAWDLATNSP